MKTYGSRPRLLKATTAVALSLMLAGMLATDAAPADPVADLAADTTAALTRQADAWDQAIVRKDLPEIAGNMADDFRQIRWNGEMVDKATFLRDITSPDLEIDPYTVEDFSIRLYGDVALLCGETRMTGRYGGNPFASHYRYIDVYVRQGDRWLVCSVQITKIPEPVATE